MQLIIGDISSVEGKVVHSNMNHVELEVKGLRVLIPRHLTKFVSRPADKIEVSKEQLEKFLYKWDYGQKLTIEDAWTELSRL